MEVSAWVRAEPGRCALAQMGAHAHVMCAPPPYIACARGLRGSRYQLSARARRSAVTSVFAVRFAARQTINYLMRRVL